LTRSLLDTATRPTYQNISLLEKRIFKNSNEIAREHQNVHKQKAAKIKPQKHIRVKSVLIQKKLKIRRFPSRFRRLPAHWPQRNRTIKTHCIDDFRYSLAGALPCDLWLAPCDLWLWQRTTAAGGGQQCSLRRTLSGRLGRPTTPEAKTRERVANRKNTQVRITGRWTRSGERDVRR
jgi:hypothetical protein